MMTYHRTDKTHGPSNIALLSGRYVDNCKENVPVTTLTQITHKVVNP